MSNNRRARSRRPRGPAGSKYRRVLALEILEKRLLRSVFPVTTNSDSGSGSLRSEIALANADPIANGQDIIEPGVSNLGTIYLLSTLPPLTRPDVTVEGLNVDGRSISGSNGGRGNNGLTIQGSSDAVVDCGVTGFSGMGIYVTAGAVDISQGQITNNGGDGIQVSASGAVISDNVVSGNQGNGITLASSNVQAGSLYNATDLGNLGTGDGGGAVMGMNNLGQVVGQIANLNGGLPGVRAIEWSGGKEIDLGNLGTPPSEAYSINDSGVIVGESSTSSFVQRGFVYQNGVMSNLNIDNGATFENDNAVAINDNGQIAGNFSNINTSSQQGYILSKPGGTLTDIGNLGGSLNYFGVLSMNNNGQLAGDSRASFNSNFHAFFYANGTISYMTSILGGSAASEANWINNNGVVVGSFTDPTDGKVHGFEYNINTSVLTDLGTGFLPTAINDNGQMIGGDSIYLNGGAVNINTLLTNSTIDVSSITAINDNGQIAGIGFIGAQRVAVLLTPQSVPEPSSHNLVTGNIVGLDAVGDAADPNVNSGIVIRGGSNNTIGSAVSGGGNVISGNEDYGIEINGSSNNLMVNNTIGLSADLSSAPGNGINGINIENGSTFNTIGGTGPDDGNRVVCTDPGFAAIAIGNLGDGSNDNLIQGNAINLNDDGSSSLGVGNGIYIGSADNTVGGTSAAARNDIVGAAGFTAVWLKSSGSFDNLIQGNDIGTTEDGSASAGGGGGILVDSANANTIGGSESGAGNVISGNARQGIDFQNADDNVVAGNLIGLVAAGNGALSNGSDGILLEQGSSDNTIGGSVSRSGNVISGNGKWGVDVTGTAAQKNVIAYDNIGKSASLSGQFPNSSGAIHVSDGAALIMESGSNVSGGIMVTSSATINIFGSDNSIDGGLTLKSGGTVAASGASNTIYGSLAMEGGSLKVPGPGSQLTVSGVVTINGQGALSTPPNSTLDVSGNLLGTTMNVADYDPQGTTVLDGNGTSSSPQLLEAMSEDFGNVASGYNQNFAYGKLELASNTYVKLVDESANSPGSSPNAVYVNMLVVPSGTTLNLNGLHLYALHSTINGTVIGGTVSPGTDNWISTSSGNWNVASNWSTGLVPTANSIVVINVPGATPTVTISSGTQSVLSLTATDPLSITGGSLTVGGDSAISGGLTMTGGSLTASGSGISLTVTGTTTISGANLFAQGGATLSLPDLTSYSEPNFAGNGTFQASGANSVLSLPALGSITTTGEVAVTDVIALTGGDVELPALTVLSGPVNVESENAQSKISLAMLADFPGGSLTVTNQGTVGDPVLTTLSGVNVTLDGTGTLAINNWGSLTSGSITVTSGTYSLAGLTDIDWSSVESEGGRQSDPSGRAKVHRTGFRRTRHLSGIWGEQRVVAADAGVNRHDGRGSQLGR